MMIVMIVILIETMLIMFLFSMSIHLAEPTKAAKSRVKMSTGLIEIERRDIVAPAGFLKHS